VTEFIKYLALSFSALLPLINPPGTALELLGVVGVGEATLYKVLARKIAVNTIFFLAIVAFAGPYVLQFFGISIEILQFVGGLVLAAMGWQLLNKPDAVQNTNNRDLVQAAEDCVASYWQSRAFYPLTFPITVGPGSVAIMLTLSAQAKSLELGSRIPGFLGLFACVIALSAMIYSFCAYAPIATKKVPRPIVHGVLRIVAFLLICIGAQIAWNGLHSLLSISTIGSAMVFQVRFWLQKYGIEFHA
jgi:multiple antibiotic resistance protein